MEKPCKRTGKGKGGGQKRSEIGRLVEVNILRVVAVGWMPDLPNDSGPIFTAIYLVAGFPFTGVEQWNFHIASQFRVAFLQ
jgi:hypothetical protein